MTTTRGSYDFKAVKQAHDDAEQVATNYVTDISNGIMVHPENDTEKGTDQPLKLSTEDAAPVSSRVKSEKSGMKTSSEKNGMKALSEKSGKKKEKEKKAKKGKKNKKS